MEWPSRKVYILYKIKATPGILRFKPCLKGSIRLLSSYGEDTGACHPVILRIQGLALPLLTPARPPRA
jgi:hypothetical protein